jgi:hypothetical protein
MNDENVVVIPLKAIRVVSSQANGTHEVKDEFQITQMSSGFSSGNAEGTLRQVKEFTEAREIGTQRAKSILANIG